MLFTMIKQDKLYYLRTIASLNCVINYANAGFNYLVFASSLIWRENVIRFISIIGWRKAQA